jgi:hypothetical protein
MNNDQGSTSKRQATPRVTSGSNEFDVEIEKLRLETNKEAYATNEHDANIAKWKMEEVRALAQLDHNLAMARDLSQDGQHLRNSVVTVIKWTLVCGTIAATQIMRTISEGKIGQAEAQFGNNRR